MMTSSITTSPIAWYSPPRVISAPAGFAQRLSETIELLNEAASYAPCVLAHSLSAEDMVLFHLIATHRIDIQSIALDTGKLPSATLDLWKRVETIYSRRIERRTPSATRLEALAEVNADTQIYESKAVRALCCQIRKTEPLRLALAGKRAWVTGLRRAQSVGRDAIEKKSFDTAFQLQKFSPIYQWADEDIWYFIDKHNIPYSALYRNGFASIGCDPCTRPIRANEHPRAGRWWWEQTDGKNIASECGIHVASAASHANSLDSNDRTSP
ncbi:MAG: phosphoadenylyl-sulfate reductase [Casimicrobium sp.]